MTFKVYRVPNGSLTNQLDYWLRQHFNLVLTINFYINPSSYQIYMYITRSKICLFKPTNCFLFAL